METFFFLSNGVLDDILERESLFHKANQHHSSADLSFYPARYPIIRIPNQRPILQITKIERFYESEKKETKCFISVYITDGIHETRCLLSKNNWHLTEEIETKWEPKNTFFQKCFNKKRNMLRPGSVIMLSEFSIPETEHYFKENNIPRKQDDPYPGHLFVLNEFDIIGYWDNEIFNQKCDALLSSRNLDSSEANKENTNENQNLTNHNDEMMMIEKCTYAENCNNDYKFKATHTISQLNCLHSKKSDWSIVVLLIKINPVKEFESRLNGSRGKFIRFQIRDQTGQMEAIGFNDTIKSRNLEKLIVDKFYFIRDCEVKQSKGTYRAWPDEISSNFELILHHHSTLDLVENHVDKFSLRDQLSLNSQLQYAKSTEGKNFVNAKIQSVYKFNLSEKFCLLCNLSLKSVNSMVDIVAILINIDSELRTIKKKTEISLRNGTIIDKTGTKVKIAFWGNQAEQFEYQVGNIIIFQCIQVSNYGGLSLSVRKCTKLMKLDATSPIASELLEWYTSYIKNH